MTFVWASSGSGGTYSVSIGSFAQLSVGAIDRRGESLARHRLRLSVIPRVTLENCMFFANQPVCKRIMKKFGEKSTTAQGSGGLDP